MHFLSFGSHNNFIALISKLVHLDCDKQKFWLQPLHRLTPCAKCNSWHWSCGLNYTSYNVFVLTINKLKKNNFTNMFMNRTSLKNLKTTWRPSSKTMVEESLNSLNFFWRNLIDWQFEKSLNNSLQLHSHSRRPPTMALCQLALHLGKKMLKKLQTLEESSSFIWAYLSPRLQWAQVKKIQVGDQTSFSSKLVQKPVWHPIIFLHKVFIPCCCSFHPLSSLNWPFWSPMAPTL